MLLWCVRALFVLLVIVVFFLGGLYDLPENRSLAVAVVGCGSLLVAGLAIDLLIKKKSLAALAGIFFGLAVGSLIALGFNYVLRFMYDVHNISPSSDWAKAQSGIMLLINVLCCYLAVTFIMQTKDDFRFIIPYVEFSKQAKGAHPLVLDTSVIIDGRVVDIAATGVLNAPLLVPRFILNELQMVADSPDRLKRNRGRRGLDMLNKMQTDSRIDLAVQDVGLTRQQSEEPVDHQLVAAAEKLAGKIVTNDYNLNKVAKLRGIEVININDLANALKSVFLPGETLRVKIVKSGDQPGQGVGYMDDGTMIVVDQAKKFMQREVDLTVTSVLQTSAGRMIFGRLDEQDANNREDYRPRRSGRSYNNNEN